MGPHGDRQLSSLVPAAPVRGPLHRAGLVAIAGAAGIALLFSPVKLCFMALALRIPCPGCGMTRATVALARGDVAQAFALHPLSPFIAPFAACLVATQAVRYVRIGAPFGAGRVPRSVELAAATFAVLLLAVWAARFLGFWGGPVSLN